MAEWTAEVLGRRFSPKEVAALTSVPEDRQRLLASRHLDFRESITPIGGHRRWSWEGVQTLAVFAEALADLGKAETALALAKGDGQTLIYQRDDRRDAEDTLLFFYFDHPQLAGASAGSATGLATLFAAGKAVRPGRVYSYNLSALQRRLCDKLGIA